MEKGMVLKKKRKKKEDNEKEKKRKNGNKCGESRKEEWKGDFAEIKVVKKKRMVKVAQSRTTLDLASNEIVLSRNDASF